MFFGIKTLNLKVVFGIGVPFLLTRNKLSAQLDYPLVPPGGRITFGKITEPNLMKKAYCSFTNQDDVTNIEAWTLEKTCYSSVTSKLPYHAREERDPLLTNTDMIWGMSGSPLFDLNGNLLGFGSNVLSNDPTVYSPNKNAVYVKALHIKELLNLK